MPNYSVPVWRSQDLQLKFEQLVWKTMVTAHVPLFERRDATSRIVAAMLECYRRRLDAFPFIDRDTSLAEDASEQGE